MYTHVHRSHFLLLTLSVALTVGLVLLVYSRVGNQTEIQKQDGSSPINVSKTPNDFGFVTLSIGSATVRAEIAETTEQRVRGLSGRVQLGKDEGMLFVFSVPGTYAIWMPDMNFPIDIIWLDENMNVVDIKEHATPESYPEKFKPNKPASYVLEVSSGYVKEKGIQVGTKVAISKG